jgi:hypothetical protein
MPVRPRGLEEDEGLPLLLVPAGSLRGSPKSLSTWAAENRALLDDWLHQAGAVLARGFAIASPGDFRTVAEAVRPELQNYAGGDSPRTSVADRVYTSTEFPPELEIGLHNELSYTGSWPTRLFFSCLVAATSGGETHIADGRKIHSRMNPDVRRRFTEKGVSYLQHLWDAGGDPGPGKSWQETFETTDRAAVESLCGEQGMTVEWTTRGLRTAKSNPGVITHPRTGEICWFNQADLWHASFDVVKDHEDTSSSGGTPADALGSHARYGDGSEISIDDLNAVRTAYRDSEVAFPWQPGDLLILDNILAMHGRKPFEGKRRILVAMA